MASLLGAHAHLAQRRGRAVRYPPDVSPFAALPPDADEADWADLAALTTPSPSGDGCTCKGPQPSNSSASCFSDGSPDRISSARRGRGGSGDDVSGAKRGGAREPDEVLLSEMPRDVPDAWVRVGPMLPGVQMVDESVDAHPSEKALVLGPGDVDDMVALARATRPGPFAPSTRLMGRYLGIRRDGVLVAMAGERMRPAGWVEVSAVCTHPSVRGEGLGSELVRAVVAGVRADGSRALLHVEDGSPARRLYERLGFRVRRTVELHRLRAPSSGVEGEGEGAGRRG